MNERRNMKISLIREEIKWCESHRGMKPVEFEDGFIAGLKQAIYLLQHSPTLRAPDQTEQDGETCNCIWLIPDNEGPAICQYCQKPRPNRSVGG
jgi:hypothetical protein